MHFELTDRIKAVSAFPDLSGSFPEYSVTITDGKSQNCVNRTKYMINHKFILTCGFGALMFPLTMTEPYNHKFDPNPLTKHICLHDLH